MMQNIDNFAAYQTKPILTNTRSSCLHMLYKIGVLKNLTKFTEKHLCWSLFSNQPVTLWKKRLRHSNSPMNFAKYLFKNTLFAEHLQMTAFDYRNIYQQHLKQHVRKMRAMIF